MTHFRHGSNYEDLENSFPGHCRCIGTIARGRSVPDPYCNSLLGPLEAAERGLIIPVFVGPERTIRSLAEAEGVELFPHQVVAEVCSF